VVGHEAGGAKVNNLHDISLFKSSIIIFQ
jgi:hypothetical protein